MGGLVPPLQAFVQPARYDGLLEMRVQHQALGVGGGGVVQVQVVVGDAAIPIRAPGCAGNIVNRLQHKRDGATGLQAGHEIGGTQGHLARAVVVAGKGQRSVLAGKHHALQPGAHGLALHHVAEKSAEVPQGRAPGVFTRQQVAPARGHHVQLVARVVQHFIHTVAIEGLQVTAKQLAHVLGAGPLFTRLQGVMLVNVVMLQAGKGRQRIIQTRRGHAPRAYGRPNQVHRLAGLRQPVAKDEAVQRPENKSLRATGGSRQSTNIARLQPMLGHVAPCQGAGVDV